MPERPKKVRLSTDAWQIITTLAKMEKKTISSFILDRLKAETSCGSAVEIEKLEV